ncbi:hypothetical protein ACWCXB_08840 [Streptomyces sp. NPDC001514]
MWLTSRRVGPVMRERGAGAIVNVSSTACPWHLAHATHRAPSASGSTP